MSEKNIAIGSLSFNTEKYILKVLEDLKVLKCPIVIIDDSSKDNSLEVVKSFKKRILIFIVKSLKTSQIKVLANHVESLLNTVKMLGINIWLKLMVMTSSI